MKLEPLAQFTELRAANQNRSAVVSALSLYTLEVGSMRVPMAEAFETRGGRISRVDLYFDPTPFTTVAAMHGG